MIFVIHQDRWDESPKEFSSMKKVREALGVKFKRLPKKGYIQEGDYLIWRAHTGLSFCTGCRNAFYIDYNAPGNLSHICGYDVS